MVFIRIGSCAVWCTDYKSYLPFQSSYWLKSNSSSHLTFCHAVCFRCSIRKLKMVHSLCYSVSCDIGNIFCNNYCTAETNEMAGIYWVYVNDGHSRLSTCYPILKLLVHRIMAKCSDCFICPADADWHDTIFRKNNEE